MTFRFSGIMHFSSRKDKTRMDTPSAHKRRGGWGGGGPTITGMEVEERGGEKCSPEAGERRPKWQDKDPRSSECR